MNYVVDSIDYMKKNKLHFSTFMKAFNYQQKFNRNSKIFVLDSENSKHLVKVWDPHWETLTFYNDDPFCPKTKEKTQKTAALIKQK